LPRPSWTVILLFYTSHHCWNGRRVPPCPISIEMGSCKLLPETAWTTIHLFYTSAVEGMIGVCHSTQLLVDDEWCWTSVHVHVFVICMCFLEKCLFIYFTHLKIGSWSSLLSCKNSFFFFGWY
jgi:hypothetical protein